MSRRRFSIALACAVCASAAVEAKTLRYAFQGTLKSLDIYALAETFTLGTLTNVYEGLVARDADLKIRPALAERWERLSPTHWRFHLRKGVTFHNGNPFTAADVVFSAERVRSKGSNLRARVPKDARFVAVDDHTVDVHLSSPNPILLSEWASWGIMDREWAEANDAVAVASPTSKKVSYAAKHANGTGPFRVVSHRVGVKTVFERNDAWWGKREHNLTRVEFVPISAASTRVAALLSGEVDMAFPIPVQDEARVSANPGTSVLAGPELRTIFLGMDQFRDELIDSNVKGRNPFKDKRVRQAVYHAINIKAIQSRIMRKRSVPTAQMISPVLFQGETPPERLAYNPKKAHELLSSAGYPSGFEVGMDCSNDRYVNDGAICQAVAALLAKVGIRVKLNVQPKSRFFAKVLGSNGYQTSFYLLGWTPSSFDSYNVLHKIHGCRSKGSARGQFNLGGYCNPEVDALADRILVENDPARRDVLIEKAFKITTSDVAYIPLHQQMLAWGVSKRVSIKQRADNVFHFQWVQKD
ncbi:MAG: ABC transporter substrate-binding protein [Pseudomonadota bacterium]